MISLKKPTKVSLGIWAGKDQEWITVEAEVGEMLDKEKQTPSATLHGGYRTFLLFHRRSICLHFRELLSSSPSSPLPGLPSIPAPSSPLPPLLPDYSPVPTLAFTLSKNIANLSFID